MQRLRLIKLKIIKFYENQESIHMVKREKVAMGLHKNLCKKTLTQTNLLVGVCGLKPLKFLGST